MPSTAANIYDRARCSLEDSHALLFHAEELLGARPNEPAQAMPASPCPAELEDVAAEQQNDSPAPAEHEDSQAQGAGMSQAGIQESADAYEQQAMEAEPAGRPRRTLKRPQKVLEGLELPSQQVSCPFWMPLQTPSVAAAIIPLEFPAGSARATSEAAEQETEEDS